jgi:UPF0755 protein
MEPMEHAPAEAPPHAEPAAADARVTDATAAIAEPAAVPERVAEPPPADLGLEPPPADLGLEPPPADLGLEPPPADQSVSPSHADLGLEPPPTDQSLALGRADQGLEPPLADQDVEPPLAEPARSRLPPPPPMPPRAAGGHRPHGPGRPRPSRARAGAVLALLAAAAVVAIVLYALLRPGHSKPVAGPAVVKVVVPEGVTRTQIAQIAARAGLRGSYRAASRRSPLLNPAHYGAPHGTRTLEGFLFPATYDEYRGAPASRLVGEQLTAFNENFGASQIARAAALHVTPYQLLTVASMVEREAQVPADRAKIAAVIYNRLHAGMPLGIDATIYYAIEQEKGVATYTRELSEAQLHTDSPYNTRTRVGLPPTPISNPGLASIEAAANPDHVSYLYYVLAPDGCGEHVFSTTLAEFEAADAAYKAAVAGNGGKPPTCKKK